MTIVIHHLQRSQSERIIWLCEELGLPYELKIYQRDRQTLLAPPEFKALHPQGTAPIITDGSLTLAESGAITEYIIGRYGNGRLTVPSSAPNYPDYLYWFHYASGTLQPTRATTMFFSFGGMDSGDDGNHIVQAIKARANGSLKMLDDRLKTNTWLAGDEFTAADIASSFTVSTMRLFVPFSLEGYDGILGWLQRLAERPAYKAMIEKGEQGETRGKMPVIEAEAPPFIGRG